MSKMHSEASVPHAWVHIMNVPCLITFFSVDIPDIDRMKEIFVLLMAKLGRSIIGASLARGVDGSKIKYVLEHGIDVEPVHAPIYAESILKALEYGDKSNQLILLFNKEKLLRTWVEVSIDTPEIELKKLQNEYPTRLINAESQKYWFSRRDQNEPQTGTGYEAMYSYWCPTDPWNALNCIIYNSASPIEKAIKAFSISGVKSD